MLLPRIRQSLPRVSKAFYATSGPTGPRNTIRRQAPISRRPIQPRHEAPGHAPEEEPSKVEGVSEALRSASAQENSLLSPVHIPEDPNSVLNERHPAVGILANSAIVVQRQLEFMNVMLGFEQANKYVIMDPQGNHIGYMAEQELGMGNMMARQWFRTHRSFTTHIFDKHEKEVLRFHRPFSWINSRIRVYDPLEPNTTSYSPATAVQSSSPGSLSSEINQTQAQISPLALSDMRIIGEAHQQWAPLRRKYNMFVFRKDDGAQQPNAAHPAAGDLPLSNPVQYQSTGKGPNVGEFSQFAYVDEPFLSWDFSLKSHDSRLIGSVNRNFAGFAREFFTDTGVYALRMDAAGLADEPRHLISQTGQNSVVGYDHNATGMTLDQRAIMLATAVSIDFDYFSRHSGAGGMGFMPLWFPGGGEAAAGGAAGAAGEVGAAEAGAGAIGNAGRGAAGMGEGAIAGAGTMAGYEAMRRGTSSQSTDDASPTSDQGQPPPQEGEEVWGEWNPWQNGQDGSSGGSGGGGGDGESDWSDWF
ncbi:Scramblase-domain-containing protein [Xylona heveae TC161]|uniref:Scramblase-domain-containing protein n=1 Tax=Xylona heveae (strain CBS 132557 / TC161) TaxID=1328760 RepID=A0A165AC73_XYLHT|nr:Scramblase-domain-containing protein [Xylona heveae TC161]KZF20241.1 Scramblase-domain-containing protein [Xylona heveae TC161]